MVSINNPYGIDSANVSPVYGQSQTFSPPMFSGENLAQPNQDSFVATQPEEKKSFYQKNKLFIWGAGIAAAVVAAVLGHKAYKLDKELGEKIGKMTESVKKLDKDKVVNDTKALIEEHKLKIKDKKYEIAFVNLKNPDADAKKVLERLDKRFVGKCKDADYAILRYATTDKEDKVSEALLKLYKTSELDQSMKDLLGEKGLVVLDKNVLK